MGRGAVGGGGERCRPRLRTSGSAGGRVRLPAGLPPLTQPLRLAVVLLDGDDPGFAVTVAPDWSIAPTDLDRDVVHDGALAAPAELVHAICTGTLDPGHAVCRRSA